MNGLGPSNDQIPPWEWKRAYGIAWSAINRDRMSESQRRYRLKHREKIREYTRKYNRANRDRIRAYKREWLSANRGVVNEYMSKWKAANRERVRLKNLRSRISTKNRISDAQWSEILSAKPKKQRAA